MDEYEIKRRISQVELGRRDPEVDYERSCEAVKRAHEAFKHSYNKNGPSASASESYAKALRELEIATHVLEITTEMRKIA